MINYINWIVLPLEIFLARILDVSIGTIRIVFVSKGYKKLASTLGFFEVLIWIVVIGELMKGPDIKLIHYIFYALGFASGNYIGLLIENKILVGKVVVRIIISSKQKKFIDLLNEKNYDFTVADGDGKRGKVKIIFLIISKKIEIPYKRHREFQQEYILFHRRR